MTPREVIERASELNARISELAHEGASLIEELRALDGEPIYDASVIREALPACPGRLERPTGGLEGRCSSTENSGGESAARVSAVRLPYHSRAGTPSNHRSGACRFRDERC